jgi:hypothetical protein
MKTYLIIIALFFSYNFLAQKNETFKCKVYHTSFASSTPKIDALLDDDAWKGITTVKDFKQGWPVFDTLASQQTEVKIIYDNTAIYIAAKLFDASADSICKQLGNRDDDLNAGKFQILFDTYNKHQDAFAFTVSASGVQGDYRFLDENYNAVWESAVKIMDDGWHVEIKIPYSALRFPNVEEQEWGLQITRNVTRNGELSQWALEPRAVPNAQIYWGVLKGIKDIKAPIRLSVTPYSTTYMSHFPANVAGENNYAANVVGGMDLKYGINESFTLDVSLLPDFSQVQSDNLVKNLGAFEIQYNEQRAFFQENTDLFGKADLFYSRRIGRRPTEYYTIYNNLAEGDEVIRNPNASKLLNIAKVSGRTEDGLGVGVLNAVLDNTYAVVRDSGGSERKVLTEPFSNYNITVFDKQLKNSSNAYLINANVKRRGGYNSSNVTGFGATLNNKKNTYAMDMHGAVSNVFIPDTTTKVGFGYFIGARKSSGKFQFGIRQEALSSKFDKNDIGINRQVNFLETGVDLSYNEYEPFGSFINAGVAANFETVHQFDAGSLNGIRLGFSTYATLKSFHNFYVGGDGSPIGIRDYFEPRTDGRFYFRNPNIFINGGFNSDNRKKLVINAGFWGGTTNRISESIGYNPFFGLRLGPTYRVSDKLTIRVNGNYSEDNKDRGYVNTDSNGDIIFGVRYRTNVSYDLNVKYIFRNNLALSFNGRHYWDRADYVSFHNLSEDGLMLDETTYGQNHDFTYNAVNIDLLFEWQFAAGSFLTLSWKNNIAQEAGIVVQKFSENFTNTLKADQLNTVSLKVLYYFDYLYLRKKSMSNRMLNDR